MTSYEAEQRKQFAAQLARKAEENVQIQSELERMKARYTVGFCRNLDGMAREKATLGNWLTLKQQGSQSMEEAVELCLKTPVAENGNRRRNTPTAIFGAYFCEFDLVEMRLLS